MPKSYSDQERAYIYRRLKEEAGKCLAQYGIRRTTVDEIVKRANIPKGTFYEAAENPILRMINSSEIEILLRKLPPNVIENHLASGTTALERVFAALPINPKADGSAFCAAFRAVYFATLHKEEIGKDQLAGALRLLVKGLINQLL